MATKLWQVGYTKKVGGRGIVTVKGSNKAEALHNAKYGRFTGSNFFVMREVKTAKKTLKGAGRNRAN